MGRLLSTLDDFAPPGTTAGASVALLDEQGRYLFFLAGTRYRCPPGEIFYAGIGGHREAGETWLACVHREAREEIGAEVQVLPSAVTWHVSANGEVSRVRILDQPAPYALYEMVLPGGMHQPGLPYPIVIYRAVFKTVPGDLATEEVQAVIALTSEQVARGVDQKPTLAHLLSAGAALVAGGEQLSPRLRLYPIGTAEALGHIFSHLAAI